MAVDQRKVDALMSIYSDRNPGKPEPTRKDKVTQAVSRTLRGQELAIGIVVGFVLATIGNLLT